MSDTDLFFSRTGMDRGKVQETVDTALKGADDGELFLEYSQSESFSFDDGRLKAASFDTSQGFGLRAVAGRPKAGPKLPRATSTRSAITDSAVGASPEKGRPNPISHSNTNLY